MVPLYGPRGVRFLMNRYPCMLEEERLIPFGFLGYRGTSLTRKRFPREPYGNLMQGPTMVLGGGRFLMSEVPL